MGGGPVLGLLDLRNSTNKDEEFNNEHTYSVHHLVHKEWVMDGYHTMLKHSENDWLAGSSFCFALWK